MMLIVLTSEKELTNEAMLLNQLFDNGLEVLHLRKPSFDIDDYRKLLNKIDDKHLSKIMTHHYHELCTEFLLKGVHLQEQPRIDLGDQLEAYTAFYQSEGFSVSSSFHKPEVLADCEIDFDYHFLSPVFSSISKQGYKGKGFEVNHINKTIIGMGGVNTETIPKVLDLGYKGVGVLGGVWNTNKPVESFKDIKQVYDSI